MPEINWLAVAVLTVGSWMFGAVWFGPVWGKLWMRIHHGEKSPTPAEMKKLSEDMWKLLVTEFVATALMIIGLACVINAIPELSGVKNAFMVWLAFVMPAGMSVVLWGNDAKKWMCTKIALIASNRLISLLVAGYVLSMWR
jgi:hypothetical protein